MPTTWTTASRPTGTSYTTPTRPTGTSYNTPSRPTSVWYPGRGSYFGPDGIPTPSSYYKMDEVSGTCIDAIGGRNLTVGGSVPSASGKINNGRYFDGVTTTNVLSNATGGIAGTVTSISLWFKGTDFTQPSNQGILFMIGENSVTFNLQLGFNSTHRKFFLFCSNSSTTGGVAPIGGLGTYYSTYNDANWHNVVATRNGGTFKLYVDGVLHAENSGSVTYNLSSTLIYSIGKREGGTLGQLYGTIDEVAIFLGTELSEGEIGMLYNEGNGLQYT